MKFSLKETLGLSLILVINFFVSGYQRPDQNTAPIILYSKKVTPNRIYDVSDYEGKFVIEFDEYVLHVSRMILTSYIFKKRLYTKTIEFPKEIKLVKKDQSEVIFMPNAIIDGKTGIMSAEGKILVEKKNQLYKTSGVKIKLGPANNVSFPKF